MRFDDIRAGSFDHTEKQRLNLSDRAKAVLLHDSTIFEPERSAVTQLLGGDMSPAQRESILKRAPEEYEAELTEKLREMHRAAAAQYDEA